MPLRLHHRPAALGAAGHPHGGCWCAAMGHAQLQAAAAAGWAGWDLEAETPMVLSSLFLKICSFKCLFSWLSECYFQIALTWHCACLVFFSGNLHIKTMSKLCVIFAKAFSKASAVPWLNRWCFFQRLAAWLVQSPATPEVWIPPRKRCDAVSQFSDLGEEKSDGSSGETGGNR